MKKIVNFFYSAEAFLIGFGMNLGFEIACIIGVCAQDDELVVFGFVAAMVMVVFLIPYAVYGILHEEALSD